MKERYKQYLIGIQQQSRWLVILGSCWLLMACSEKFVYNNADWLSIYYADDYIDFNRVQKKEFKSIVKRFITWHRQQELPKYYQSFTQIKQNIQPELTVKQLGDSVAEIRDYWPQSLTFFINESMDLLWSLSEEQRQDVLTVLAEEMDELGEKREEQWGEGRAKRIEVVLEEELDYYDDFLGSLSLAQKEIISIYVNQLVDETSHWQVYAKKRHQALVDALAEIQDKSRFKEKVMQVLLERESFMSDAYRVIEDERMARWLAFIIQLNSTLSTEQQEKARTGLDETIELIDDLVKEV